ncbi:putative tubulin polyglutamylase TTLL2 [Echeneis naucrates]|uniref:putative tubulin polyglutamylase TTLL2 n=1 Tax=Echeneis naucrates TaxID=173247 RepID=UPI001114243D|nr:probable tubulin polyglutamylase TTLL2 [Echeneis naucrates]
MAASLVFRLHDRGPDVVREVLLERGWEEYDEEERGKEDWNLYWRASAFRTSDYFKLLPWQRLNHHPQTVGITRKDCLARHLRRMRAAFGPSLYDFSPTVFILPNEYLHFLTEYNKGPPVYWICKPVDLSRGRGIFIFEDIKDFSYSCSVIVQKYISDPLLISGYKFDLRIYVCVKSFHPLTIYIHQEGLVRFATEKYNLSSLENMYSHLTNTSINKFGPFYMTEKGRVGQGCKWTICKFRHFLRSQDVDDLVLWQRINNIVTLTLLSIAPFVPLCPNCVELFGFDILIDAKLKPWLLEVNYSPALTLDCQADITVKKRLVGDLIDLMNYTSIDSLREKAYQQQTRQPCLPAVPVISKFKEHKVQKKTGGQSSQPLHQAEKMNPRQCAFVSNYRRQLPPVNLNKIHAGRGRQTHTSLSKTHRDMNVNRRPGLLWRTDELLVNRLSCPALAPRLMENRSPRASEVTNRDDTETEAELELSGETEVSSKIPDIQKSGPGFRRSVSCKLPNIYSGSQRPGGTHLEGQHPPPLRVGGFIRTFPFNTATLKASQQKLDVKTIIQELHKLTGRVASNQSDRTQRRTVEEEPKDTEGEGEFDSLFLLCSVSASN